MRCSRAALLLLARLVVSDVGAAHLLNSARGHYASLRQQMQKDFCRLRVFGGAGPNVLASSNNVVFESGRVLVVEDGDVRVMAFVENADGVVSNRCQEEAEVQCLQVSTAASPVLLQTQGRDQPGGLCNGKGSCSPNPTPRLSYVRSMIGGVVETLNGSVRRVLIIGLGGGSLPLWFANNMPSTVVETVDVSPDVVAAAPCMGVFESSTMHLIESDGRAYLEQQEDKSYDAVFLDAYTDKNVIPPCLRTIEFLEMASRKLVPGGVLVANMWPAELDQVFTALAHAFPTGVQLGAAPDLNNIVLLARAGGDAISKHASMQDADKWSEVRGWAAAAQFTSKLPANSTYAELSDYVELQGLEGAAPLNALQKPWQSMGASKPVPGIRDTQICEQQSEPNA